MGPARGGSLPSTVNLTKLTKQLRREARTNPKKAAVLGLLALAALYFWAPKLGGWVADDPKPNKPPVAGATLDPAPVPTPVPAVGPSPAQPAPTANAVSTHPWTRLDEWIRQDPRTTPTDQLLGGRDPFTFKAALMHVAEDEPSKIDRPDLTPQDLRLELSSTVVGPRRRMARIAGQAYEEGETIQVNQDDQPVEFQLVEVHPRRIVLQREGALFELVIPQQQGAGRIRLSGTRH